MTWAMLTPLNQPLAQAWVRCPPLALEWGQARRGAGRPRRRRLYCRTRIAEAHSSSDREAHCKGVSLEAGGCCNGPIEGWEALNQGNFCGSGEEGVH